MVGPRPSEYGHLSCILVKHVRAAFISDEEIGAQWRRLNYSAPPEFARAVAEYDRFLDLLAQTGAELVQLPSVGAPNLDSIYTRDASVVGPGGVILCRMGKQARCGEPAAQEQELRRRGWPILGSIAAPGCLEGGDLIWLDGRTLVVGQGRRTNAEGIRQLCTLLNGDLDEPIVVTLPEYRDQQMSAPDALVSPVADLAGLPRLAAIVPADVDGPGYRLVEAGRRFETMGTNVLALGPRDCVMVDGNPQTRTALERAGARVQYAGAEISKGVGPTCQPVAGEMGYFGNQS
jgi:N-dimethylarginine dimethylaminohydrolase